MSFGPTWTKFRWRLGYLVVVATITEPATARAQSNYRNAPIGGRSQLLGGTGMTYGRDATAAFLNPATAVLVDDKRLSFSVNFYSIAFARAPHWYTPGPVDRSKFGALRVDSSTMTDLTFDAMPSSLCIFFRGGDIPFLASARKDPRTATARIGFCFATVQSQSFNFSDQGFSSTHSPSATRQSQTVSQNFTRFAAGPTYAMHITDAIAIGGSLHASLANHRSIFSASGTTYGSGASPINTMFYGGSRGSAFQLEATAGATLRLGKQTLGLSLKSPSVHVYGSGGATEQSHFDGAGNATSMISADGSFVSRSPLRVGLGTGIEERWGMAEFNTTISAPTSGYSAELKGRRIRTANGAVDDQSVVLDLSERARGVVNFAAGVELFVSPKISFLGGLSTDFSAVSPGQLQRGSIFRYYPTQTHRVAGSFGVSSHGTGGELLVGGEISVGWGDRLAVNSYQLPPVMGTTGQQTFQLMLVVAGSTSLRVIQRAVEDVRKVLEDPKSRKAPGPRPYNPRDNAR